MSVAHAVSNGVHPLTPCPCPSVPPSPPPPSLRSSYGNSPEPAGAKRISAEIAEFDYSDEEGASPAALAAADRAAAADMKTHSTPPGVAQRQKQERRTTASPSALEDLMSHIGDDRESEESEDDGGDDSDAGVDSPEPRASRVSCVWSSLDGRAQESGDGVDSLASTTACT